MMKENGNGNVTHCLSLFLTHILTSFLFDINNGSESLILIQKSSLKMRSCFSDHNDGFHA